MENGLAVALAAVRNALQARQKASPALQTLARVRENMLHRMRASHVFAMLGSIQYFGEAIPSADGKRKFAG